jgi:hypothetical protein
LPGADYIAEIAIDIGLSEITWASIAAWCSVKRVELTPWESAAVMAMARSYSSAVNEYNNKTASAPYSSGTIDRAKVDADVRSALRRRR